MCTPEHTASVDKPLAADIDRLIASTAAGWHGANPNGR